MMADLQSGGSNSLCLDQVEKETGTLPPAKHSYIPGDQVGETGKVFVRKMQVFAALTLESERPEFSSTHVGS